MNIPQHSPPKWAQRLLNSFLREELKEEVNGDLAERFRAQLAIRTPFKAKIDYWMQVLQYLRPFAIQIHLFNHLYPIAMYRNYFKIAWRSISRHKVYSAIKIGGLAVGVAACFLIGLFIKDELSYDAHYPEADRLFRLINVFNDPEEPAKWPAFPAPIAEVLKSDFPDIEEVARLVPYELFDAGKNQMRVEGKPKSIFEEGFAYADPALISMLDLSMVYGNVKEALSKPQYMVLSRRKAEKYFPEENPVGKTIILNENTDRPYLIGGVMENFPENSHLQFDFFLTMVGVEFWPGEQMSWCCSNYEPYIKLREGADLQEVNEKLQRITSQYLVPFYKERGDKMADRFSSYHKVELQALGDIHLYSEGILESAQRSDILYVWMFGVIAVLILLLAGINFVNLSTAKSINRAKEVGLRKVIGSRKSNLVRQFLTESILISALSVMLGLIIAQGLLPLFNGMAEKNIAFPLSEWWLFPIVIFAILLIGILAGLYPAFYLSAYKPIRVLKGEVTKGKKGVWLRGSLVVVQFACSILLIIGAITVHRQMEYILNKKLGYNKEQVLVIEGTQTLREKHPGFKNELSKLPEIVNVASSNFLPIPGTMRDMNQWWREGMTQTEQGVGAQIWRVDHTYLPTLEIQILEGRNFSHEIASDSQAIIINQAMAKKFGFENPIGERITNDFQPPYHIIGVIEDFHFESFKGEIKELAFALEGGGAYTLARIQTPDVKKAIGLTSGVWEDFMPNQSFRYTFLDESFAAMYKDVGKARQLFTLFAMLAIFIACLGLFALSAFMAEQRRKEISIRKVLGASFQQLFGLLTANFMKLLMISLLIAIPLGYLLMEEWLMAFAYRTFLSWDIFVISGALIFLIALITISFESIRTARLDPARNLQNE